MQESLKLFVLVSLVFISTVLQAKDIDITVRKMQKIVKILKPLHKRFGKPKPGDWLFVHSEPGQTFEQYRKSNPSIPTNDRDKIYILPIGDFTKKQKEVVHLTAKFTQIYYDTPVKIQKSIPLSRIPDKARRTHPSWRVKQILTTYVLEEILKPRLPKDAAAYLALTSSDLWPGRGWNFVFGQALLRERVGVWSISRNGAPDKGEESFKICLIRTIKTAVHELGHMFSMKHCILYECAMNGSNSLREKDERPVWLCPECLAKICWAFGLSPLQRYKKLEKFCRKQDLKEAAEFYKRSIERLENFEY